MVRQILIKTAERGQQSDIRFFAGETLGFSVDDPALASQIVLTIGPDKHSPPEFQKSGQNGFLLSEAELGTVPEGEKWHYNIWLQDADGQALLRYGFLTSVESIAPTVEGPGLVLSGVPASTAALGETYSFQPVITGGVPPYSFSLTQGALEDWLSLDAATGLLSGVADVSSVQAGLIIGVIDGAGATAQLPAFDISVGGTNEAVGTALVWRWGQSNEGTLGNHPGQTEEQYRGAFPSILQVNNVGNTFGPDETFELIPYAILDDGDDDVVIDGETIAPTQGEYTIIGSGPSVGPTFGMANEIRDGGLFGDADKTWFWKASSAGKSLAYFIPRGEEASYAVDDNNLSNGWRYKCYANRQLRAELANATLPVYVQCAGDWQGEADVAYAGTDIGSAYITQYAAEHAKVYQADVDALGVEPPYFKVALRRIVDGNGDADPVTDALNVEMANMCRYAVDLSGAITDTGSGHARMYFVDHGLSGIEAGSTDPHVSAEEQRLIGVAISNALRTLNGGNSMSTAYELMEVKPQLSGVSAVLNGLQITVSGYYSDPGVLTVTLRDAQGAVVRVQEQTITDDQVAQTPFEITVSALPDGQTLDWDVVLTLPTGEVSVSHTGSVTTAPSSSTSPQWDDTFNTSDFVYSETNTASDTVTRLDTVGARYPRAMPTSGTGKIYFELSSPGGITFAGIGVPDTPQNGGSNGVTRAGILNSNIQHTGGSVSAGVDLSIAQLISVAVDLDAEQLWIRSSGLVDWNNTVGADPAAGVGGLDISGLDTSLIVPLTGIGSEMAGVTVVLLGSADVWVNDAPSGFSAIG